MNKGLYSFVSKNETLRNSINKLINEVVEKKTKVLIKEIETLKKEVKDIEASKDFITRNTTI